MVQRAQDTAVHPLQRHVNVSPQGWKQRINVQYLGNNKKSRCANEASTVGMLNGLFNGSCFLFMLEGLLLGDTPTWTNLISADTSAMPAH